MARISLTDFVDIVSAAGTPKATKVRQIKNRPEYHPSFDFYKRLRERIIEIHEKNLPRKCLDNVHELTTDTKKVAHYINIGKCYKKWWGKKKFEWFAPENSTYESQGIVISVNPELGLIINGTPHLIKLYFKASHLSKSKADLITHLMADTLYINDCGYTYSVLDIQNKRLISKTSPIYGLNETINAELAYISTFLT